MLTLTEKYFSEPPNNIYLSIIHSILEEEEESIKYLHEAYENGYFNYRLILVNPVFDNIRDDERVQKLISGQKQKLQKMQDNLAMMEAADELKELRKR